MSRPAFTAGRLTFQHRSLFKDRIRSVSGNLLIVATTIPTSVQELEARLAHSTALVRRLYLQYDVSAILAESESEEEALPQVLQAIARNKSWDLALAWVFDEEQINLYEWLETDDDVSDYIDASRELALEQVNDLPSQVLNAKDVVWVNDLGTEINHSRHAISTRMGWCNAVAFPLQHGQKLLGVIELVRRECEPLEEDLKGLLRILGRDIARFIESVRYEDELEKKNARLAQAQLIARMGIWEWRPSDDRLRTNDGTLMALGLPASQAPRNGQAYLGFVPEPDRQHLKDALLSVQNLDVDEIEVEHTFESQDGLRLLVLRAKARTDRHGRLKKIIGMVQDITERAALEQELRLTAVAVEQAAEAMVILNKQGSIVSVNPAFTRITGYNKEEVIGKSMSALLHWPTGKHDDSFFRALTGRLLMSGHWEGEVWAQRKNGEQFPELLSISVIRNTVDQITHYVGVFNDISDQKDQEERLRRRALYDPLTALPNRFLLLDHLEKAIERASRRRLKLAVCFMDLDHFKPVNDTYGHETGDQLLKQIAVRLLRTLRRSDFVARLGGDEFVLVLEDIDGVDQARSVAQKVVDALHEPFGLNNATVEVGCSIGIALYPDHAERVKTLLRYADEALYETKEAGRDGYRVSSR
ncbi:MAG TPA: hypothetical protein DEB15_05880 [Pusillimonas sp.]|jgi:diguanylate cyclase (GGDEF)-like protein/PAS domain S-box-containing protein|nr:hypothetical protein [Pusillimonas sp.]|tara:strand:- start:5600 stop:7531 length:1932 start_codon:yes stop_codon:yes gene_type:complete